MVPERIEQEIVIEAPPEVVWSVLTEPEHIGAWFSDAAEVELRRGGAMTLTWEEHGSFRARVEKVEPPYAFSFRWARPEDTEPQAGNSTLVEFSLQAEGESTRLRVVESGFRELDLPADEQAKYAEGNTQGWQLELDELREYAAKQVGAPSR
jgi:uncharacterized protein YndB with AHSA1/START domain